MDEYESLSHTKWDCKNHVVFIPKQRRKTLYGQLRRHLGDVFRDLAKRKDSVGKPLVVREALKQFVMQGACYAFPAMRGGATRGMPTSHAAPPLKDKIVQPGELPPVWPDKNGVVRGMTFHPLYPTVPLAAGRNAALYELLVLFDAVRGGSPRERALALTLLDERLGAPLSEPPVEPKA